ncbi:MAG: hypothetical protein IJT95_01400 [Abditibacteriota bacterium]|nr:hypothetical protein [Abditibacteriota bacterium]
MLKNKKVWLIAVLFAALVSVPYLWALVMCPRGGSFLGFTRNIDDMAVYMSWIRQTSAFRLVTENLFQERAGGYQFNIYFIILGLAARALGPVTAFPEAAALHVFRVLQALVLPFVFYSISAVFLKKESARLSALTVFLFAAGFGFLCPSSVDSWQPEAITFMSAYLNPLFTVSLILMLLCLKNVFERRLPAAAVFFFLLGNVHTYDSVITALVWAFAALWDYGRTKNARLLLQNLAAGLFGALPVIANFIIYSRDAIYKSRVDTVIGSPEPWFVVMGFGLPFLMALAALCVKKNAPAMLPVLVFWLVCQLAIIYIPFSQQRKFIMGYMIPVAVLAGSLLPVLLAKTASLKRLACLLAVALFAVTNMVNMQKDMGLLLSNRTLARFAPYMSDEELALVDWVDRNADPEDVITAPPQLALFLPGLTGRRVYYGHWSETPDYGKRVREYGEMCSGARLKGDVVILPAEARTGSEKTVYRTENFIVLRR